MSKILSLKKTILPIYASAMIATATLPATANTLATKEQNSINIEQTEESNIWDFLKNNSTTLGIMTGLGLIAGAKTAQRIKYKKELREKLREEYPNDVRSHIKHFVDQCNYYSDNNIKEFYSHLRFLAEQPYAKNKTAQKDFLEFLDKYANDEYDALMTLPAIIYHCDKMISSKEEWEIRRQNYPEFEIFSIPNSQARLNHLKNTITSYQNLLIAIRDKKQDEMVKSAEKLREILFNFSPSEPEDFAACVKTLDILKLLPVDNYQTIIFARSLEDHLEEAFDFNLTICENGTKPAENKSTPSDFSQNIHNNAEEEDEININEKFVDPERNHDIKFTDIGGQENAIKQLSRKILFPIQYPDAFNPSDISHGIMLYGPPGTGKTMLANALANEADVKFIKMNGLELINKYVGASEENFRKLFKTAKENQPCIIFLDEFDAIARKRSSDSNGRHDDKIVNQLLTLLSDIEKDNDNIFVITATNRLDIIDPAILRNKRIGAHIEVGLPKTTSEVESIFDKHAKNRPIDKNFNKATLIEKLLKEKASGADIASVISEALENAYERSGIYQKMKNKTFHPIDLKNLKITDEDFEKALCVLKKDTNKRTPIGFNKE